jgi:hypothetical protein
VQAEEYTSHGFHCRFFHLRAENFQASPSLRAAEQVLKQQMENMSILEKESPKKMETPMEELEEYHLQCRGNETGYYDAFRQKQRGNVDSQANLKRLEFAGWWDEIIQYKFDEDELPDDFQCRKEWIIWCTQHRPLVEPLDIANYCRLGKKEDSGFYGRPSRYRTCGWKSMMRTSNGKHPRRSLRTGVSGHMLKNLRA